MKNNQLKEALYNYCKEFVNSKLETIEKTIKSNQADLASETKSSAGDKHETGRAMLQLEMEKAGKQLKGVTEMKLVLERIKLQETSGACKMGSIVKTNTINYFLAISAGKIVVENEIFYAVSSKSPIGQLLIGKKKNDTLQFNGNQYNIDIVL
ncbi:MAG: transcription elongation GreA/GreB family factor [Candidatus Azotimanducaceae bacterium]|jgi:transcription elongation GreA/GreB family factor